jgi:broad specificity phosphatase PhoE
MPLNHRVTKVVLARHGETEFNRNRIIMGRADSALTQDGIRIAAKMAPLVEEEGIDAAFSSPLGRALASARIYAQKSGLPLNIRDAMAELACGEWEGRSKVEVRADPLLIRDAWDDRPPGGESYRDAEYRVGEFIREIRDQSSFNCILVVGHAGVNRVFLRLWLGLQPEEAVKLRCPHDAVFILGSERQVRAKSLSEGVFNGLLIDPK